MMHFCKVFCPASLQWALLAGGRLGVGNDPRYNKSCCFETFPFPSEATGLTPELERRIRALAEQLDAHPKARQAAHDSVTLTGLYNVLDKLRRAEPLNAKDKTLHEQGLVSVLQSLHDELDAAVLKAYGWSDLGPVPWADEAARAAWTETLLVRLVALNAQRAAEEATGQVRWLRPEFQDPARRAATAAAEEAMVNGTAPEPYEPASPAARAAAQQAAIDGMESAEEIAQATLAAKARQADEAARFAVDQSASAADRAKARALAEEAEAAAVAAVAHLTAVAAIVAPPAQQQQQQQAWPATLPEQVRAVAQLLAASPVPQPLAAIEAAFKGKGPWKKGLPRILETLEALGRAQREEGGAWRG